MYTITLADGTTITDLELNGNNYVSKKLIDDSLFEGNLSIVSISDGEVTSRYINMELVQNTTYDGKSSYFILSGQEIPEDIPIDELRSTKLAEIDEVCTRTIYEGFTMALPSSGKDAHFSLKLTDQNNLQSAGMMLAQGADSFPYHKDGELCIIYDAQDMQAIIAEATKHKLYHTAYGNHLMNMVRALDSVEDILNVRYGMELPTKFQDNFNNILEWAGSTLSMARK